MWSLKQLELEERKNRRTSAILTTIITMVLLLISFMWSAWRKVPPPPGEIYEVVGAIDFGDLKQGSRQVNNFEKAIEDPAPSAPKPQPKAKPVEQPVKESLPEPDFDPVVNTPKPSPVVEPETKPTPKPKPDPPKPKETVKPKPKPQPEPTKNDTENEKVDSEAEKPSPNPSNSTSKPTDNTSNKPSGSNQGNETNSTGNAGTPDIKKLDPEGLYSFGEGIGGGANQRAPLYLPRPTYNVQEEGEIRFQFVLKPDGSVAFVKALGVVTKPGLRDAGIAAIKKWKFTKDASAGNQRLTVTIKFRLKG